MNFLSLVRVERKSIERVDIVFTISYKDFIMEKNICNIIKHENIEKNGYLTSRDIEHYWLYKYIRSSDDTSSVDGEISEDIRILKNQFCNKSIALLQSCSQRLETEISEGLNFLVQQLVVVGQPWVVVAVPRSKATFRKEQLYLIKAISNAVSQQPLENGTYFIKRVIDTQTTHLSHTTNIDIINKNNGPKPYPGITKDTCSLCGNVRGKNVILIDDIYTHNVNIDEDCAQFLFDKGANNVILYTLCKT